MRVESRHTGKIVLALFGALLVAGNLGDGISSTGGFQRLGPYIMPAVIAIPELHLEVTDDCGTPCAISSTGEPAILKVSLLWRAPSHPNWRHMISYPEYAVRQWVTLGRIAILAEDLESGQVHLCAVHGAENWWQPIDNPETSPSPYDPESRSALKGLTRSHTEQVSDAMSSPFVSLRDVVRFVIPQTFDLTPGTYDVWAVYFADPPYGAGLEGEGVEPTAAHLSPTPLRPWMRTQTTQKRTIAIVE